MLLLKLANRHNLVHHRYLEHHQICRVIHPPWQGGYSATGVAAELSCFPGSPWNWQPAESFKSLVRALFSSVIYSTLKSKEVYQYGTFFLMVESAKCSNLTFILEGMSSYASNYWTHKTLLISQALNLPFYLPWISPFILVYFILFIYLFN